MKRSRLHRHGSNQYQTRPRVRFIKGRTWFSILAVLLVTATISVPLYTDEIMHRKAEQIKRSLHLTTYAWEPGKEPELAPMPERLRNIELIRKIFGSDAQQAIRIFTCESGLRSNAVNERNSDGYPDVGIAQIHLYPGIGFTKDELFNPVANLYHAKSLFDRRGWQPWDSSRACWEGSL